MSVSPLQSILYAIGTRTRREQVKPCCQVGDDESNCGGGDDGGGDNNGGVDDHNGNEGD